MSVAADNQHLSPRLKHMIERKWERKIKIEQQQERGVGLQQLTQQQLQVFGDRKMRILKHALHQTK